MKKIWFDSFWGLFDKQNNVFVWILSQITDIEITPINPDIIFTDNRNYRKSGPAKVIYFSGEPFFNIGECDFALTSFYVDDPRFFRFPLYLLYAYDFWQKGLTECFDSVLARKPQFEKTKFCAYLAQGLGGPSSPREYYVNLINKYKQVDCAGKHLNNYPIVGGEPGTTEGSIEKIKFLSNYKFALAIENNDNYNGIIGYTTEKIFEPMIANCIPIYWGNQRIEEDFNPLSFINAKNFDETQLIEYIKEIDTNENLFKEICKQPYILNDKLFSKEYLKNIFTQFL